MRERKFGRIVNMVSKRPKSDAFLEVGVATGSYNLKEITLDGNAPLIGDSLLGRLNVVYRKSDDFVKYANKERIFVAPSLTWNIDPSTHLTLLGLPSEAAAKHRTVDLKLPVFSAVSTPDGAHAIAILKPPAGSKQPGAFAVVPVAKDLPAKIQGTQAVTVPLDVTKPAAMVAIDDQRALVTVTDGVGISYAYLVAMPELTVDAFQLDSVPLPQASGLVLEANQAFVAQQHPEGRITFIDLDTRELHTLTGFELATQVGQ